MSITFLHDISGSNNDDEKITPLNDLLKEIGNEECIGIIFGKEAWGMQDEDGNPSIPDLPIGKLISLLEAKKYLNYEYDDNFGSPEVPNLYAWTPTRVIFIHEYDGSTKFVSVPRNPITCIPESA